MVDFRSPVKVMIKLSKHSMPLVGWPNVENTNYVSTTHTQKCQMTTFEVTCQYVISLGRDDCSALEPLITETNCFTFEMLFR